MDFAGSGASAGEDYADGAEDDLEIEPEVPFFDVGHVEGDVAVKRGIAAALHLPETGDAGGDIETAEMAGLVLHDFAGDGGTRSDDTHVATKDIEELRQLVERILAENAAEPGDARIIGDLEEHAVTLVHVHDFGATLFRIAHHGAELVAAEDATLFADALGGVEDRSMGLKLDGDGDDDEKGRKNQKEQDGKDDI